MKPPYAVRGHTDECFVIEKSQQFNAKEFLESPDKRALQMRREGTEIREAITFHQRSNFTNVDACATALIQTPEN